MALSGREILLILRARDEASRVVGRVSASMRRMDRDAIVASQARIRDSEHNLTALRRHMHEIQYDYQQQALAAQSAFNKGKLSAAQYRKVMIAARAARITETHNTRMLMQAQEDMIRQHRENIDAIYAERDARRHAGQAIMANGFMMTTYGAAAVYAGTVGVAAWLGTAKAAMDYEQQARRSLTQVDKNNVSLRRMEKLGIRIGRTVPVAFEEIQPALYDVFSSIDVGFKDAGKLVKQFAKDAVGGQTELQVATRANLQIMNAYKIGVKDAADVSDFMFQLVRKGVGTYEEFATTIGRSIPSARRAGQSYRTLGAMIAFMTRNGLSAAMASTSAARALDAISHPKTVDKMEKLGITVKDLHGEFLPLPKILDQLNEKFGDLTAPQRAKRLYELFKSSGGTIQARRFFDQYFKNADEFNKRTREMQDTAGEAEKAFKTMAKSPQAELQRLINNFKILAIQFGTLLLPILIQIVQKIVDLLRWFQDLDPEVQRAIAYIGLFGSALVVLLGILTVVFGAAMIFVGGAKAMGTTAGAALLKIGNLAAGLVLLVDGLRKVTSASTDSEKAIGTLETVAGGAVAGFAVGGPIGAAIGGFAGLLASVVINAKRSGDSVEDAAKKAHKAITDWSGLADTLDQTTGMMTKMTAAMIANKLQSDGTADELRLLGIDLRTATQAVMGNKVAVDRVSYALKVESARVRDARKEWKAKEKAYDDAKKAAVDAANKGSKMAGMLSRDEKKAAEDAKEAYLQLKNHRDAIAKSLGALKEQRKVVRENAATVGDYGQALKRLPKEVRQQIQLENVPKTMKELAELINKYKIVDKKTIKSLIELVNHKKTMDDLKKVQAELKKTERTPSEPEVTAEIGEAMRKLGIVQATLTAIDHDVFITVHVNKEGGGGGGGGAPGSGANSADKGFMGIVPNKNEIKKQIVKTYGELTAAINAMNAAALRNFADLPTGPALQSMENAFNEIENAITNFTDRQEQRRLKQAERRYNREVRDYEKDYRARREAIKKKYKGDEEEKHLAALERQHNRHLRRMENDYNSHIAKMERLFDKLRKNRVRGLQDEKRAVIAAANAYDLTQSQLNEWVDTLAAREGEFRAHIQMVRDMVVAYGDITRLGERTNAFGDVIAPTAETIIEDLERNVNNAEEFMKLLDQLAAAGLNEDSIQQILNAGVDGGLAIAQALAAGGPEAVARINELMQRLRDAGVDLGESTGHVLFDEGIEAARRMVDALTRQLALDKEKLENAMAILGAAAGDAINDGLKTKHNKIMDSVNELAKDMEAELRRAWGLPARQGPRPGGGDGGGRPGPGETPPYHPETRSITQSVTVYTQEIDPVRHAAQVGWELATRTPL